MAATHAPEEVTECRIDAERVTARRDHRVDLIDRQLEPRINRVERRGALRPELIKSHAVDEDLRSRQFQFAGAP